MRYCSECGTQMIDNVKIEGQHPFELGADGRSNIRIDIPTGEKADFLGLPIDKMITKRLKARVCLRCGKVEVYIDVNE